eukprot:CAMPEP_0204316906 /NCGR_PEP_ID=MMETSP0469-20131031/5664_1 /ASSEMBLY_ACC=CAM_ASM_000384 /TAXON_ID=2969 /ORGANISM="Oxyrrhis marina" /LENGTH=144 /DNA_ID=CAMNT_0051297745 /DNA_START=118 /DNA_END=550 /DNA_ORIENTATION=-
MQMLKSHSPHIHTAHFQLLRDGMQVQVKHRVERGVENVAPLRDQLLRDLQHVGYQLGVRRSQVANVFDVLPGDNQEVLGGYWLDIVESHAELILVPQLTPLLLPGLQFPVCQLAKEATVLDIRRGGPPITEDWGFAVMATGPTS